MIKYEKVDKKGLIRIKFVGEFTEKFKNVIIVIGNDNNELYSTKFIET